MANVTKVTREGWIEAAKAALIEHGVAGIKVDRLARDLGVSRGGFYHNFTSQQDLLRALLEHWQMSNDVMPDQAELTSTADAVEYITRLVGRFILEEEYSPAFDHAIREWARVDSNVRYELDRVEEDRIRRLAPVFRALGYDDVEADIRARILYYHQVGYYALGHHIKDTREVRFARVGAYLKILCGRRYAESAGPIDPTSL